MSRFGKLFDKLTPIGISTIVSGAIMGSAMIWTEHQSNKLQLTLNRQHQSDRLLRKEDDLLSGNRHREYSDCMQCLYHYKGKQEQEGVKYDSQFKKGMDEAVRDGWIVEINRCRSVTKDYWTSVYMLCNRRTHNFDQNGLKVLCKRYQKFVALVKPLDDSLSSPNNNNDDEIIYNLENYFCQTDTDM